MKIKINSMQKIIRPVEEREKEIHIKAPLIPEEYKPIVMLSVVLIATVGIAYIVRRIKK